MNPAGIRRAIARTPGDTLLITIDYLLSIGAEELVDDFVEKSHRALGKQKLRHGKAGTVHVKKSELLLFLEEPKAKKKPAKKPKAKPLPEKVKTEVVTETTEVPIFDR